MSFLIVLSYRLTSIDDLWLSSVTINSIHHRSTSSDAAYKIFWKNFSLPHGKYPYDWNRSLLDKGVFAELNVLIRQVRFSLQIPESIWSVLPICAVLPGEAGLPLSGFLHNREAFDEFVHTLDYYICVGEFWSIRDFRPHGEWSVHSNHERDQWMVNLREFCVFRYSSKVSCTFSATSDSYTPAVMSSFLTFIGFRVSASAMDRREHSSS